MSIKIRGKGKNKLKLEFEDESFSLVNILRQKLWESEGDVDRAEYRKDHAYLDNLHLLIETKGSDPVDEVLNAADMIKKEASEIVEQVEKF